MSGGNIQIYHRYRRWLSSGLLRRVVWYKFNDVLPASIISAMIALIMETASISETSVNFYQTTQHNNLKDSHLHTHRCENDKSDLDRYLLSR
jgi:hypothetical protein